MGPFEEGRRKEGRIDYPHVCISSQEKNKRVEPVEMYHARHTLIEGFT